MIARTAAALASTAASWPDASAKGAGAGERYSARHVARLVAPGWSGTGSAIETSMDAGVKRVETHAVHELGRALDIPDGEVGALAGLQRAGLAGHAQRAGGLAGDAGEALVDRHAKQR